MSETDPLDRLSRVANQSEQPTPEFSDRLLTELLGDLTADGSTPTGSSLDHTTNEPTAEVIMLSPDRNQLPQRSRTGLLVAASVAAIALVGGLVIIADRDEPAQPADLPTPTTEPTGSAVAPEVDPAKPLPAPGSEVEPGTYETDLLGISMKFDVVEATTLWTAEPNRVLFADAPKVTSPSPADVRTLSFTRISGWNTPEEAVDPEYSGPGSVDPADIDGWAAANGVVEFEYSGPGSIDPADVEGPVVTNPLKVEIPSCCRTVVMEVGVLPERVSMTTFADRQTLPLTVWLDPADTNQTAHCDTGQSCLWAASVSERGTDSRADTDPLLSTGQVSRFWLLTIDGSDPLLIHASAAAGDEAWLDQVFGMTLELGPDAPPMSAGNESLGDS